MNLPPALRALPRFDLGAGGFLLVSARGGRLYGPFLPGSPALDWWPDSPEGWNLGGERVWIAPEALFNYTDPARMVETYRVDPALDPGQWQASRQGRTLRLQMQAALPLTQGRGRLRVAVERAITAMPPRRGPRGTVLRYRQDLRLRLLDGPALPLVPWLIRQVAPGCDMGLSATPGARAAAAFGTPPAVALAPGGSRWQVPFRGPGFFKTLYPRGGTGRGRLVCRRPDGPALIWRPSLAPSADYPETLPGQPDAPGQFAALFYDDGRFGAYGEAELYGHRDATGGRLSVLCLFLCPSQATEISSTPI